MKNHIPLSAVLSSRIDSMGHDPKTDTLAVRFKDQSIYHYRNVPASMYDAIRSADSIGRVFDHAIKSKQDVFPFTKCEPEETK